MYLPSKTYSVPSYHMHCLSSLCISHSFLLIDEIGLFPRTVLIFFSSTNSLSRSPPHPPHPLSKTFVSSELPLSLTQRRAGECSFLVSWTVQYDGEQGFRFEVRSYSQKCADKPCSDIIYQQAHVSYLDKFLYRVPVRTIKIIYLIHNFRAQAQPPVPYPPLKTLHYYYYGVGIATKTSNWSCLRVRSAYLTCLARPTKCSKRDPRRESNLTYHPTLLARPKKYINSLSPSSLCRWSWSSSSSSRSSFFEQKSIFLFTLSFKSYLGILLS